MTSFAWIYALLAFFFGAFISHRLTVWCYKRIIKRMEKANEKRMFDFRRSKDMETKAYSDELNRLRDKINGLQQPNK